MKAKSPLTLITHHVAGFVEEARKGVNSSISPLDGRHRVHINTCKHTNVSVYNFATANPGD